MKIAILSDIHDNVWTLRAALSALQAADALICCGDLCSPFTVPLLAENFSKPIHLVFGNNDGDLFRITKNAARFSHFNIEGELFLGEFGGLRFAVNHYDNIALPIAQAGHYDVVCCGHNHRYQVEQLGPTLLINPGTLLGYSPLDKKDVPPTYVLYETATNQAMGYQVQLPDSARGPLPVAPYG